MEINAQDSLARLNHSRSDQQSVCGGGLENERPRRVRPNILNYKCSVMFPFIVLLSHGFKVLLGLG
jgi:hypothetical protein